MKVISYKSVIISLVIVLPLAAALLVGFSGSNIKDDFCGVHINFQYCKCAFHNEYCGSVGMSRSEAKVYIYAEYNAWLEGEAEEYGVIERDGNLYLNSEPGKVLSIKTGDLPIWARDKIATIGAVILVIGPPDTITEGDSSVLLDGLPVARVGDGTAHGGNIIEGSERIFVNGIPVAFIGGLTVDPIIVDLVPAVGGPIVANVN